MSSKKRKLNNNDSIKDNVSKALDLLKFQFKKETDEKKLKRLKNILIKLERFSNGELDHKDDLDEEELNEQDLNEQDLN